MAERHSRASLATDIASFVADVTYSDIPPDGIRTTERAFVDTIGVTLAGSEEGAGKHAMELAAREQGDTPLLGRTDDSSLLLAVFANATAGHALDFDDTALSATDGHPSVPMVASLLAVGEREHATGRDLLTAYVAGFETQAYLNAPISPGHYEGGWHATATLGTFGATAATASILDLSASEIEHALNIAASMPAGLKRNFGSMTKPIHAGQAARSGVSAALLAAEGVDAAADAIGGDRGFLDLYRGVGTPDLMACHDLGEQWVLLSDGIDIKKYACCYYTHAAIDGTTTLVETHDLDHTAIEHVRVRASRGAVDAVQHDDPETPTQAKFSMPYLVAYACLNGTVDLAAFEEDSLADTQVQALRERVTFEGDEERSYDSYGASITVETTSGTVYEHTQERPPGTYDDPLTDAELREKFEMCARRALSEDAVEVYDRLNALRNVKDIADISVA